MAGCCGGTDLLSPQVSPGAELWADCPLPLVAAEWETQ